MATQGGSSFNEDELYDRFPPGADIGFGQGEGYAVKRRINDESLFTEDALADPVIRAFVDLPFDVGFIQTKSSTREAEWLLHKPHLALAGEVPGIDATEGRFDHAGHITTLMVNHERTMARWKQSILLVQDGNDTTEIIYKQNED